MFHRLRQPGVPEHTDFEPQLRKMSFLKKILFFSLDLYYKKILCDNFCVLNCIKKNLIGICFLLLFEYLCKTLNLASCLQSPNCLPSDPLQKKFADPGQVNYLLHWNDLSCPTWQRSREFK